LESSDYIIPQSKTTMGFLTTITIHNDALHQFEQDPEGFAKAIFNGINEANRVHHSVNCSGYGGYLKVFPSKHADDKRLYLHAGGTLTDLCHNYDPKFIKPDIQHAKNIIESCERRIKIDEEDEK
jgi:hypothetical protein